MLEHLVPCLMKTQFNLNLQNIDIYERNNNSTPLLNILLFIRLMNQPNLPMMMMMMIGLNEL